jgi:hypothetical protein
MIYNLAQFLRNNIANTDIFVNEYKIHFPKEQVPDKIILIKEVGGTTTAWYGLIRQLIKVVTRDIDTPKSRELAYEVWNNINNRFGLTLPAVTVDGNTFDSIQILQINSNGIPQSIGEDENGRSQFQTSYEFIYRLGGEI